MKKKKNNNKNNIKNKNTKEKVIDKSKNSLQKRYSCTYQASDKLKPIDNNKTTQIPSQKEASVKAKEEIKKEVPIKEREKRCSIVTH